jgi:DNA-3-methyladenine glycosylase
MYHCLNFVTEPEGFASAVLIRGVKLVDAPHTHLNGPGKLCRHLGIDLKDNAVDIATSDSFYVIDMNLKHEYATTPRIGTSVGKDKLWRFVSQI